MPTLNPRCPNANYQETPLDGPYPVPGSWLAGTLEGQLEDFGPVTDSFPICFNGKTNPTPPADSA